MKFTIEQSALSSGLSKIQSAISNKPTVPILTNILIVANADSVTIKATDLDISLTVNIKCDVKKEGSTTIPAKKFTAIIKQLPSAPITIDTKDSSTSIKCNKSRFKILGMPDTEYPIDKVFESNSTFTIDNNTLKRMIDKISYSVSSDVTRLVLNGVLFNLRDNLLSLIATDGRRLAMIEKIIDGDISDIDLIIPHKSVTEIQKLLSVEGDVKISIGDSRLLFKTGSTVFSTRLIEGNYPNFRQVIPAGFKSELSIPRVDLSKAINRVSLVLNDLSSSVKMEVNNDKVIISAASNTDESSEPVAVDYDGENTSLSFNPQFIQDPLKHLDCNNITLKFNDSTSPMCVSGDDGFIYIIMPMRN